MYITIIELSCNILSWVCSAEVSNCKPACRSHITGFDSSCTFRVLTHKKQQLTCCWPIMNLLLV